MAQSKTVNKIAEANELANIKNDLSTLRKDLNAYVSTKADQGKATAEQLKSSAQDNLVQLKGYGRKQMENVEDEIRQKPGRAVAIAAAAGLFAGFLFSRKG